MENNVVGYYYNGTLKLSNFVFSILYESPDKSKFIIELNNGFYTRKIGIERDIKYAPFQIKVLDEGNFYFTEHSHWGFFKKIFESEINNYLKER